MSGNFYLTKDQAQEIKAARKLGRKDYEIERDIITGYVPDSVLHDLTLSELRGAIYFGYNVIEKEE